MNTEKKDLDEVRLGLAGLKQQLGKAQSLGSSGAQSEDSSASAGVSTAEANAARAKAAPSPSFEHL
eukprot:3589180-Lingulodinium_polyedra.AAC.1